MHRRRNFLFSNWKKRQYNILKSKKFKRERRLATYCAHYFVYNGFLGFYAYFFINSATIIFTLLIVTIGMYFFIILKTIWINFTAYQKTEELVLCKPKEAEFNSKLESQYMRFWLIKITLNKICFVTLFKIFGMEYKRWTCHIPRRFVKRVINFLVFSSSCILINITPKNVHPLMTLILIPVELISIIIRPISLAVRMFANLAMGHVMIAGFNFATSYPCGGWWGWFCTSTVFSTYFYLFELIVVFLQSIIFLYLMTTYFWGVNEIHN